MKQKGHACRQAGLAPILIIVLIAALAVGGYLVYRQVKLPAPSITGPVGILLWDRIKQNQPTQTPSSTSDTNPTPADTGETTNWKTYTSDEFSFKYPSNWGLSDCGDPNFIYLDVDGINCAGGSTAIEIAKNRFPDGSYVFAKENLIEKRTISLNGKDALQLDFTGSSSGFRYTVTRVKIGNSIYDITFNPDSVLNKLPKRDVYDQVLSTFKFTN